MEIMETIDLPFVVLILFVMLITLQKLIISTRSSITIFNLPPGPRKLPFIGNLHLFVGSKVPPAIILRDFSDKYGPLMSLQLGQVPAVVVSSPELAKQVMTAHDTVFAFRPSLLATEVFCYGNIDVAFAGYGKYWTQLRKTCVMEALSAKRVQSFAPVRANEFSILCRWMASNDGSSVNLTEKIRWTDYDILSRVFLGKKNDHQEVFIALIKQLVTLLSGVNVVDLFPSIKAFRAISGLKGSVDRLRQVSDRIFDDIIDEHKLAAKNVHESKINSEDMVEELLKFQNVAQLPFSSDNIKAVLIDMFVAGIETSAKIVGWAMKEMMKNPRVMKTAQDEVRRVFDAKGYVVDESSFDELKYLKLVIKETFRLYPPVPLLLPRESSKHCEIDGYYIPAKTRVFVNVWAIGRDPRYWKDPESFIPKRFLDKTIDYQGDGYEFIPFGAGRRICPGLSFGLANVEHPLAMFLYHFDWVVSDKVPGSWRDVDVHAVPFVRRPLPTDE